MNIKYTCYLIPLFLSLYLPAYAEQSSIVVESLQAPGWVENKSGRHPLQSGMSLEAEDRVQTGASARVVLRLAEGSHIKLGENVNFVVKEVTQGSLRNNPVFAGIMRVVTGAFRFTTSPFGADKRRNLSISVGTATMGIRGTDVWGRASENQDLVCLIEGSITVDRQDEAQISMEQPLSVYIADHHKPAQALSQIDPESLGKLALETELDLGRGVLSENGKYTVFLLSSRSEEYAKSKQQQFWQAGYPANVFKATVNGLEWYRVGIKGYATFADAKYFVNHIAPKWGIKQAWIKEYSS